LFATPGLVSSPADRYGWREATTPIKSQHGASPSQGPSRRGPPWSDLRRTGTGREVGRSITLLTQAPAGSHHVHARPPLGARHVAAYETTSFHRERLDAAIRIRRRPAKLCGVQGEAPPSSYHRPFQARVGGHEVAPELSYQWVTVHGPMRSRRSGGLTSVQLTDEQEARCATSRCW
jgi:hypothetical protein